jgi:O-antigen/teichoic acid export membrane protein
METRVARGFSWSVVDVWGRQTLNLVVFVVLANLLLPADFGLVALAGVFVQFAQVFVDQGLGDALIQRRNLTRRHIDTAFWTALAVGTVLTAGLLVLATPISAVLHEPRLEAILRVLSLTFVLTAMTSIQIALLRRELAFRSLAMRTFAAVSAGGVAGIVLAALGFGAWALVGQQLVAAAVSVVTLWWVLEWHPSLHFARDEFRELYAFGIRVVGSDVLTFISRNADNLLIGAVLGTIPLGFYAVGYRILDTTQQLLISITRKVSFPALSALQHEPKRMRRAFFRLSRAGGLVIMPGYVALAFMAPDLTVLLFGARWRDAGTIASVLLFSGPVFTVQAFTGPLLYSVGHPGVFLRFQLIQMVANVTGFVIAVPFGITAVAVAYTVRAYVLLPLNLAWIRRYAAIPTLEYLSHLRGIAMATAFMALLLGSARFLLPSGDVGLVSRLLIEAVIAGASLVAALWLLDRRLLHEIRDVARLTLPDRARNASAPTDAMAEQSARQGGANSEAQR